MVCEGEEEKQGTKGQNSYTVLQPLRKPRGLYREHLMVRLGGDLSPLPGTPGAPGKPSWVNFLLSLGATVCCSLQRHNGKEREGRLLQPPFSKALVFLLNLKCISCEGQERKIEN